MVIELYRKETDGAVQKETLKARVLNPPTIFPHLPEALLMIWGLCR